MASAQPEHPAPSHPDVDLSKPGQTCPVVGAKTEHHASLHKHPNVELPAGSSKPDAGKCPVISNKTVNEPKSQAMDDKVCPVVGSGDDAECPVTKAKIGHHKDKVTEHPSVANAAPGAVCPVVGHA
ncbi:hypothetical protein PG997_006771 [Apiospora hydei]|uniref:Uncharacterized protein n=1 Tax=Apiospora hydei TaxID=1337664 RepID=A0ABR1WPM9_9PEZI